MSHYEQKHVQDIPGAEHIHHRGGGRMQTPKDREDERRGEKRRKATPDKKRQTEKDRRDERKGEKDRKEHTRQTDGDKADERRGEKERKDRHGTQTEKDRRDERKGEKKVKAAREHYEKVAKTSKLGTGKRFKALSGSVAAQYEAKGKSPKEAERIAGAVAASAGRAKYGAKRMGKMAAKGRK